MGNGIFQWTFFPSKVIVFTKPPSFSLKMDLDNLEFGVSDFFFFLLFFFCSGRDPFWCSHAPLNRAKPGYNYFLWDESSLIWKRLLKLKSQKTTNPRQGYFYKWCILPRGSLLKFQLYMCVCMCVYRYIYMYIFFTYICSHIYAYVHINTYIVLYICMYIYNL